MSTHNITTVVIAALTLLCPYFPCEECCDGCINEVVAETSEELSSINKACCSSCEPVEQEPSPVLPECPGDGKLLTCFCGGAVVTSSVNCPELADSTFSSPFSRTLDVHGPQVAAVQLNLMLAPDPGCHFPPLTSGRDIRNLSASYLL